MLVRGPRISVRPFVRALENGNLRMIRAAAAELPQVGLEDATRVCVVLRDREPERLRSGWIVQYCIERPDVGLRDIEHASQAFRHRLDGGCPNNCV